MKERPIIFSAPMVRAILAGTKTQTRRVVKPQPKRDPQWACGYSFAPSKVATFCIRDAHEACPYGKPGDRLWVRETWRLWSGAAFSPFGEPMDPDVLTGPLSAYACEFLQSRPLEFAADSLDEGPWRSPIHMPRWASRMTLEITGVRVERLQSISEADAKAEGAAFTCDQCGNDLDDEHGAEVHAACDEDGGSYAEGFHRLWNSLHGDCAFAENPWVWCISFRRV